MGPKVRFYTDEHVAEAVTHGLRQRGVDGLTVGDAGMLGATDVEQLAWARSESRVRFTQDPDFLACMGRVFSTLASFTRLRAPR